MNKKYVIKYRIIFVDDSTLEDKEIKISNCQNGVQAQVRLEDYLKRKYGNFKQLIVSDCKEEPAMSDIFSQFGDIFGGKGNDFGSMFGGSKN